MKLKAEIKLIISDVDGTLCTNSIFYSSDGVTIREFSTFDGEGFNILRQHFINVVMVSQSKSREIERRASWLKAPFFGGISDKIVYKTI